MIADMLSHKKPNPIVTELFIRGRKLNISLALSDNLIFLFQKILDYIQHTIFYENSKQKRTSKNCI